MKISIHYDKGSAALIQYDYQMDVKALAQKHLVTDKMVSNGWDINDNSENPKDQSKEK